MLSKWREPKILLKMQNAFTDIDQLCQIPHGVIWQINCTVLKLHDMCHNPKYECQKQFTFTPKHFQLDPGSIRSKLQKLFKLTQSAWNKFLKPAINATAPFIVMAVSAQPKNPKVGEATTNILKSISGGKVLSLTDMHGNELRLKDMWNHFKDSLYNKMDVMKKCSKSKTISSKCNFFKDITKKDGYWPFCKICCQKYSYKILSRILNDQKIILKRLDRKKMPMKDKREKLISILNYFVT